MPIRSKHHPVGAYSRICFISFQLIWHSAPWRKKEFIRINDGKPFSALFSLSDSITICSCLYLWPMPFFINNGTAQKKWFELYEKVIRRVIIIKIYPVCSCSQIKQYKLSDIARLIFDYHHNRVVALMTAIRMVYDLSLSNLLKKHPHIF